MPATDRGNLMSTKEWLADLIKGTAWEIGYYGDSFICPCGDEIELDGECPQGCISPMMSLGMI
jgi:hypothetical protein